MNDQNHEQARGKRAIEPAHEQKKNKGVREGVNK